MERAAYGGVAAAEPMVAHQGGVGGGALDPLAPPVGDLRAILALGWLGGSARGR